MLPIALSVLRPHLSKANEPTDLMRTSEVHKAFTFQQALFTSTLVEPGNPAA